MGKSAGSPPPAPDYKGAAEATTKSQQVSQYTPYGSQVYSQDASSPSGYRSDINLTPQAQNALGSQLDLSSGLGNLAQQYLPQVQQQYSQPMGSQSVQDVSNQAYGALTSRLDPQWDARSTQNETKLINQGLRPGDEAYTNAMRDFGNQRNDAYQQANLAAIQTMPQTYQLESSIYNQPLNTLNAIRSGAQVQNPQFGAQPGTNYAGAAQSAGQYGQGLYNADVSQANSANQGLYGIGAAGLGAYGTYAGLLAMSDRRLKRDITKLSEDPRGFGIYRFRYLWDDAEHIGVMADEVERVMPEAVFDVEGYKAVNYGAL